MEKEDKLLILCPNIQSTDGFYPIEVK